MHDFWLVSSLWIIAIALFILPYSISISINVESDNINIEPTVVMIPAQTSQTDQSSQTPQSSQTDQSSQTNQTNPIPAEAVPDWISDDVGDLAEMTSDLFDLVNEQRTTRGIEALMWDNDLAAAAKLHAQDQASRDYISHVSPDGDGPQDRIQLSLIHI